MRERGDGCGLACSFTDRGLRARAALHRQLFSFGCAIYRHAWKVLAAGTAIMLLLVGGLARAQLETAMDKLWVEEGGRLQSELAYTSSQLGKGAGMMAQMVIQTPRHERDNVISQGALVHHLNSLQTALGVQATVSNLTWTYWDLCFEQDFPKFNVSLLDSIIQAIIPCIIITPLDCFWEGGKLLGPEHPVKIPFADPISWKNIYPPDAQKLLSRIHEIGDMKLNGQYFFDSMLYFFERMGIKKGYVKRPCLDPVDPECPAERYWFIPPRIPDVGQILNGGCDGFGEKFMHWPEDLIIGGAEKDEPGKIKRAEALQTIMQMRNAYNVYKRWGGTPKTVGVDWSEQMAEDVLVEWQRNFSKQVLSASASKPMAATQKTSVFTVTGLNDRMAEVSKFNPSRVLISYVLMLVYVAVVSVDCTSVVRSQSSCGVAGVCVVTVSTGSGLGLASLLGISSNTATTQVIPFLAFGLGVHDVFLILHTFADVSRRFAHKPHSVVGETIAECGLAIILTAIANMAAFFTAYVIPIPAMRAFSLQAGLIIGVNLITTMVVFIAILSLDQRRRLQHRLDLFCCFKRSTSGVTDPHHIPNGGEKVAARCRLSLAYFIRHQYAPLLQKVIVKVVVLICLCGAVVWSIFGVLKATYGMDILDYIPEGTNEYDYLKTSSKYFSFYEMSLVTKGNFDYPNGQRLLHELHGEMEAVPWIVRTGNGTLPQFWLQGMRDWLRLMEGKFDHAWREGLIWQGGWSGRAQGHAILAYKMLAQTGDPDMPYDESRVNSSRLVLPDGTIPPALFYQFLSAWIGNDRVMSAALRPEFRPRPPEFVHDKGSKDLNIPASPPLQYTQMPFFLNKLGSSELIIHLIQQVRAISARYSDLGLPNYPQGIPFTFFEPYVSLKSYKYLTLACILAALCLIIAVVLVSPWTAVLVVLVLAVNVLELIALMGWTDTKISSVHAVIIIMAVGLGVKFALQVGMAFLTSSESRNKRMLKCLELVLPPVFHGAIASLLGLITLAFSEFDFVVKYFFMVLTSLIIIGLVNGVVTLPVILSLIGPPSQSARFEEIVAESGGGGGGGGVAGSKYESAGGSDGVDSGVSCGNSLTGCYSTTTTTSTEYEDSASSTGADSSKHSPGQARAELLASISEEGRSDKTSDQMTSLLRGSEGESPNMENIRQNPHSVQDEGRETDL